MYNEKIEKVVVEKKFIRETSIFADFKVDTKLVLDQCFAYDRKHWKLPRLTKDAQDLSKAE